MAAPGIAAFGDGSHAPGASGIAVQGGGFGAFPGSVWVYENADRTGDADELDIVSWNGVEATVDIPGTLTNTAGTRYLFLQRSDLAWSNAFAFTLEAAGAVTLSVQEAAHAHAVDNVALTQAHTLALQDASHAHAVDNVALSQANTLAAQDTSHGHAADNVTLIAGGALEVNDSAHGHAADNVALTAGNALDVADSGHAHTVDNAALVQAGSLSVQDALHAHAADILSLQMPGKIPPAKRLFVVPRQKRVLAA